MDPVTTKTDAVRRLRAQRDALAAHGVVRLGLFGSFRHDRATPESDVDLFAEFDPSQKTFASFMEVADLLEAVLGRRVDLLTRASLSPHLGPRILADLEHVLELD